MRIDLAQGNCLHFVILQTDILWKPLWYPENEREHIFIQWNVIYPEKRMEHCTYATTCLDLENVMLSEGGQSRKATGCVVPFV